jgi:hypothetical protein
VTEDASGQIAVLLRVSNTALFHNVPRLDSTVPRWSSSLLKVLWGQGSSQPAAAAAHAVGRRQGDDAAAAAAGAGAVVRRRKVSPAVGAHTRSPGRHPRAAQPVF